MKENYWERFKGLLWNYKRSVLLKQQIVALETFVSSQTTCPSFRLQTDTVSLLLSFLSSPSLHYLYALKLNFKNQETRQSESLHSVDTNICRGIPPSQLLRPPKPTSTPHMVGALSACTRRLCANNPAALNAVSFMDYTRGGGGTSPGLGWTV